MALRAAARWLPPRLPHLSIATAVALLAASLAGLSQVTVTQKVIRQGAQARLERDAREVAAALGQRLASLESELAFLSGSPALEGVTELLSAPESSELRWRRVAAEGTLLLMLRAHPDMLDLEILAGDTFVRAARRGNVPVVWRSAIARGTVAATSTERAILRVQPAVGASGVLLRARLDADALVRNAADRSRTCACTLRDRDGRTLATAEGYHDTAPGSSVDVAPAAGWLPAAPWSLRCAAIPSPSDAAEASARKLSLALGATGILCSVLLAGIGLLEGRRRHLVEMRGLESERQRDLERQLLHADRLGTVGRLAAGLAHEINNPLEGMANYLALAEQDVERGDPSALKRHLGGIGRGLQMASSVTRQVLDFADPTAAATAPVDLARLLQETVAFVAGRRPGGEVRVACADLPAVTIPGHEVMLRQLFLNLLLNGCEAQPQGGEVLVSARDTGGAVRVAVADRGPGVAPENRGRIFEPFFTTKSGTGLGLALAHAIVKRHGGSIAVEDRPGGGAVFAVTLPGARTA